MKPKGLQIFKRNLPLKCILILLVLLSTVAQAKNYYVAVNGNNSNDGLTQTTAWQTISKVNSFSFEYNDFVLFKRGDTFYGGIVVSRSNLNFGAYGTGANPIISGLSTITGWINLGGNIWEAPVTNVPIGVNLVLRDGKIQQIGRYPNPDVTNGGYLTYTAATTTSITGPALSSTTNWTGAELAIRLNRWDIRRQTVTSHSAGVVSFASNSEIPRLNYGYFFQRDARTLDQDGEWWHNETGSKLRMYFGNNNPDLYNIQIATIDTLFKCRYSNSLTVSDLVFYGSGKRAIWTNGGTGITIKNCDVINSGAEAITCLYSLNVTIDNCTTTNSLGSGIRVMNNDNTIANALVKNCTTINTAFIVGMETTGDHNSGAGIACEKGDGLTIQNNSVINSGYIGISWQGDNVNIKNNFINTFCTLRDDGGGIYSVENAGSTLPTRINRKITGNILINGLGNNNGTNNPKGTSCSGLYFDLGTRTVLADSNTVAYTVNSGFHGNNNSSLTIKNNVFFGNGKGYSLQRFPGAPLVRNMAITKNLVYPYKFYYGNSTSNIPVITREDDILAMGTIDSNYYSLKSGTDTSFFGIATNADGTNYKEVNNPFSYLTGTIGIEKNSINVVNTGTLEYNASNSPRIVQFSGLSKKDVFGNVYNNSVTIAAWRSVVLIPNGTATPNKAPIANAGVDKTILLPISSSTLTGTGTDADGTIASYAWTKISGPSIGTIVSPAAASTTINALIQGVYKFELKVTDNNGAIGRDTVQVNVNIIGNQIPAANAGANKTITLPANSTTLTGTGTDTDGTIASYAWTKISGPSSGTIASPAAASTAINSLVQGVYQFELKVTDNGGAIGKDTVQVSVNAAINQPPIANAGIDKVITLPTNSISVSGVGTDADGNISSYTWTKISGPFSGTIASPAAASTALNSLIQGIYQFEFSVTDNNGAVGKDTIQVTVNSQPVSTNLTAAAIETINCFGNTSTVNVTASGGVTPYTGTGSFNTDAGKGALKISFPISVSSTQTTIYLKVGSIVAGKSYVLRFSTLGSMDNVQMDITLKKYISPFTLLAASKTTSFGTSIKQHEFIFTPTISDADSRIDLWLTQNTGTTYLDNIAFFEASPTGELIGDNIVTKGQFETDISAIRFWSSNGNQLVEWDTTSKIDNINYYSVTDASGIISTVSVAIKQPATVLAAAVSLGNTNILTVSATGGASPYSGTGTFTAKFGLNTFIVTDANGCSVTTSITIPPLTAVAIESPVNCSGTTAAVNVTGNGGTGPYTGTGIFNTNAGKGTLKISFPTSVSTTQTTIYFRVFSIVAGKSYVLRFSTLGTMENVQMDITLKKYVLPFTLLATSKTTSFGTSIKQHEFIFTPTISDDNARIDLWLNQNSGTTYIDNIAFFEATPTGELISDNIITKGQFETDISAIRFWSSNGNQLLEWDNTSKIKNINYYTVTDATGVISTVGLPIKQSATVLTAAVSLGNANVLTVAATGGTSPYTGTGTFTAKIGLNTFNVTDANGCSVTTSINVTQLVSARVSARIIPTTTVVPNTENSLNAFKISCFPNPAINEFGLLVEGKNNEKISILVMSEDGRIVFQTTGTTNKKYNFGENFAAGLYVIKVTNGNDLKTLKVIKSVR